MTGCDHKIGWEFGMKMGMLVSVSMLIIIPPPKKKCSRRVNVGIFIVIREEQSGKEIGYVNEKSIL